jgi:hypothetical protein
MPKVVGTNLNRESDISFGGLLDFLPQASILELFFRLIPMFAIVLAMSRPR